MKLMQEKSCVRAVRIACALLAGLSLLPAQAEEAEKVQRVVITGSNISRIDLEGPTPVEVIRRDAIEKSGAATVSELLSKLPSMYIPLDGSDAGSFAAGASSVQLRGMDAKYVLILLNGRRLANYGFADGASNSFVDLNSLPLAAIESVEILRDGASAIYGSDAVAGVINFKTRKNYRGTEASVNAGNNQKGDGANYNVSVTTGFGDIDNDGRNVLLTAELAKRTPLWSDKHGYYANPDYRRFGGTDKRSSMRYLGSLRNVETFEGYAIPGCRGTIETNALGDQLCLTSSPYQLTPHSSKMAFSGIFTQQLSGGELFAEAAFTNNKTTQQSGMPVFDSSFVAETQGSLNPGLQQLPAGFLPGDRLQVFRQMYEAGMAEQVVDSDTLRLVAGWRGSVRNWDSEAAFSFNQNKLWSANSKQVLKDAANAALQAGVLGQAGGYDPFVYWNPASVTDPLLTTTLRRATSRLSTAEWKMSNPEWFSLGGAPVGFAWGAQISHESLRDTPDARAEAGQIAELGATRAKASRTVISAYGELNLPVHSQVEVQAALRADHYSDFGNSLNPKLAAAWRPASGVLVRAAATTSFKAPTLPQLGSSTRGYVTVADWARCKPMNLQGADCAYTPTADMRGNAALNPEKALNLSAGIVLQPVKDLSLALDWFALNQRDTIQLLDAQYLIDNEDRIPGFAAMVLRDPRNPVLEAKFPGLNKGRLKGVIQPFQNVGKTEIQGVDLDLSYTLNLGERGKLKFREAHSQFLSYKQSVAPGAEPVSRLGGTFLPKWNNTFRLAYEYKKYEGALTARTVASTLNIVDPSYEQDPAITRRRIPSFTAWDANVSVRVRDGWMLNAGVNNLFDKAPVYANSPTLDSIVQYRNDVVGRYFYLNMRYSFN
ncbi:TonB-dependent receptor [Undibacterium squillarum]|uniref:TonB-dependent receptor n=1 Tax=Undibacterium squillarum TaxID=1131567 RepID=UPI0035B084F7